MLDKGEGVEGGGWLVHFPGPDRDTQTVDPHEAAEYGDPPGEGSNG
eukprot:gene33362-58227_t